MMISIELPSRIGGFHDAKIGIKHVLPVNIID